MIDEINETREEHILTIEDPIEFLHSHKKCMVNQRELGSDAQSFAAALKAALRQDPDVILVGEMRDLETISTALTAAETGHLVFATLHTQSAPQTIDRVIDVFPPHQQQQVRVAAVGRAAGRHDPDADPDRRRLLARRGLRDARADRRGPQPHPRGQDPPDPVGDADRLRRRHADDGRRARRRSCAPGKITQRMAEARSSTPDELKRLLGGRAAFGDCGGLDRWPPTSSRRWTSPARRRPARSRPRASRSSPTSSSSAA